MSSAILITVVAVAVAGGFGATTRFAVGEFIRRQRPSSFPVATMGINISGSFALGLLSGHIGTAVGPTWMAIAGTGLLGGYTTFSTASVDAADLWTNDRKRQSLLYTAGTGLLAVGAAAGGYLL